MFKTEDFIININRLESVIFKNGTISTTVSKEIILLLMASQDVSEQPITSQDIYMFWDGFF